MENNIVKRQPASTDGFVSGAYNAIGLHARFFELTDGSVIGLAYARNEFQSYPGRLHGGVLAALTDEAAARALWVLHPTERGVTVDASTEYLAPVPIGQTLRITGKILSDRHIYTAYCEILLEDGTVAVTSKSRFLKLPFDTIASGVRLEDTLTDISVTDELKYISTSGKLVMI